MPGTPATREPRAGVQAPTILIQAFDTLVPCQSILFPKKDLNRNVVTGIVHHSSQMRSRNRDQVSRASPRVTNHMHAIATTMNAGAT